MPVGRLPGVTDLTETSPTIRPLDLLDPAQEQRAREWSQVHAAVQREQFGDKGSPFTLEERQAFQRAPEGRRVDRAAYVGGRLVGALEVAMPLTDNLEVAFLTLSVAAAARRRGVGAALLRDAEQIAREHGRSILMVETEWAFVRADSAEGFARAHGYDVAQTSLRSELSLPVDRAPLRAVLEVRDDYAVESFVDQMPGEWVAQRAVLQQRMSTDAPTDGMALGEEAWDAERLRGALERTLRSGRRIVETVARHVSSGELVGFTQVHLPAHDPALAYQEDTLVLSEHRGHALGLRLKAANALLLMEVQPAVRSVRTWNSETNRPMLAVNRALGYVIDGYEREWQKVLR